MLFTISKIEIEASGGNVELANARGAQLNYAIKPTRQSWDFSNSVTKERPVFKCTNLGIDGFKFSVPTEDLSTYGLLGKVVGDELRLFLSNAIEKLSATFTITDIAVRNGYTIFRTMFVNGSDIEESKAE